jgi:membrane protein insertase Oxa1/YidC/SpoIIIJ
VDISGQTVLVDISGQTVDISGQTVLVDISGQSVNIGNTVTTDVYGLLNNQRLSAQVWAGVQVAQNETSSAITPSLSSYCNTVLSCYGSSTENAVIAVQFSNDTTVFYTTQYQYTLTAGDFGFSIPCSALSIRLKLLSPTTTTLIAFIDIC